MPARWLRARPSRATCTSCGLDLQAEDSGDGPAVFLIFILGFTVAPLAVWAGVTTDWPVWVHVILWGGLTMGMILSVPMIIAGLAFIGAAWRRGPRVAGDGAAKAA